MVKNTKLWPLHFLLWCTSSPVFSFLSSSEFPFPTVAPTPAPPRTKHKLVVEGKKLTFRCGKKIASKKGKVQWVSLSLSLQYVISLPGYSDATVLQLLSAVSNVRILFQLVQGRGAAGVLSPKLHLTERRPHYYSGQRHQRRHVHLHR